MFQLNPTNLEQLILGSTALATGGGLSMLEKRTALERLLSKNIPIKTVGELDTDELFCTLYGVGPLTTQPWDPAPLIAQGLNKIQNRFGKKPVGFFVGETGAETLAFEAADASGVCVVDADATGGRAVPEITQDLFVLQNVSTLPALILCSDMQPTWIENGTPQDLEKTVRTIAQRQNAPALVFDHFIKTQQTKLLCPNVLAASIALGDILQQAAQTKNPTLLAESGLTLLATAVLNRIQTRNDGSFFVFDASLSCPEGTLRLLGKNENLVLLRNNKPLATCPHSLILLDQNFLPIHNSDLADKQEQTVFIFFKPADARWQTKKGAELFGPAAFGFPYPIMHL